MPTLTVRNVPEDVHRALKARAARSGRSMEAEVREILAAAVKPEKRVRMGDELVAIFRRIGVASEDLTIPESVQDMELSEPVRFD